MRFYSDFELLELLEANNKEPSYSNLCILKEGIENGTIELEDDEQAEVPAEEPVDEIPNNEEAPVDTGAPVGEMQPSRSASITPDGTVQMHADNKEILATPDGTLTANIYDNLQESEEIEGQEVAEEEIPEEELSEEIPEEMPAEDPSYEEGSMNAAPQPGISISLPVDGSMQLQANNKTVTADPQGNVNVQLTERFLNSKNTDLMLESFLVDDCGMTLREFRMLTENEKVESVKEIAAELLDNIQDKLTSIDTTPADKSRGDIKQLKDLGALQDSITQLETVIERDENARPEYKEALGIIIKSILYVNQHSNIFKDAYRNKKTLMILKYESIILSIVSCVSYMISAIIDCNNGDIKIKNNTADIMEFAPFKALEKFVNSVESGEFKTMVRDVTVVREFYLEIPVEKMEVVLEAADYSEMIINGIKTISDAIADGDSTKIINLLYKAAGIIVLLFSLRDAFYTIFKMKTKVNDMLGGIRNFADINNGGGAINKLNTFSNKFKTDAESSSELAQREIADEDRNMFSEVKKIQYMKDVENPSIESDETTSNNIKPSSSAEDLFGFDF